MDTPSPETSFVRQTLTDTLSSTARPSKQPLRSASIRSANTSHSSSSSHSRSQSKDLAARRNRGDDDSASFLRSLGLQDGPGAVSQEPRADDTMATPRPGGSRIYQLPSGPEQFYNPGPATVSRSNSTAPTAGGQGGGSGLSEARRKLAAVEKERDEYAARCKRLERQLAELSANGAAPGAAAPSAEGGGKVLGAREYEELERQFDAQEKLLSGYQRENQRSLIELEAQKRKLQLWSRALAKVYGPDFESTLSVDALIGPGGGAGVADSPGAPAGSAGDGAATAHAPPPAAARGPPNPEQLANQLSSVQLLVTGMERRLVQRQSELEELEKRARKEGRRAEEAIAKLEALTVKA